jgi:MYXO-CTERM domain-containing protein
VAVVGSAGLEYNAESTVITNAILESIAIAKTRRLGDAFAYGLAESVNRRVPRDSRQLFNLLGDPALMLYPESVDEQAAPLPAQGCDCRGAGGPAGLLSLAALGLLLGRWRRQRSIKGPRQSVGSDLC